MVRQENMIIGKKKSVNLKPHKFYASKLLKVAKTKNERIMLLSKCAVSGSKKSRFIKEQEVNGLLRSLVIKTPLSKIPSVGPVVLGVLTS